MQLVQLQPDEAALGAELDDVALDLFGDPPDHLAALQHRDHVAQGDEVLDLEGGERRDDVVEAELVALEGLQRLVGPVEQAGDRLERVLGVADVDGDDAHVLATPR